MTEYLASARDLPGSRRAPCLGCGGRIVTARDAYVRIGGKRDGSLLMLIDAEPLTTLATDADCILTEPDLELLGVAHRACAERARRRLEAQEVDLPQDLPHLLVDEEVGQLPDLGLPPAPGACPFCGGADTSEEHVWPKWVSRELGGHGGFVMPSPHGPHRLPSLAITAPVCGTCNNRWLSVLENDVQPVLRPMIRGEERRLPPEELRLLSAWAVKTALMLDLASGTPFVPTGFYHDVRQRRGALASNVVWVGAYCGSRWAAWARHTGLHIGISNDEPPNAFVTTFTAFRIVLQVVGHFTKGSGLTDTRLPAKGLARIWPPSEGPIDWPPGRLAFSDEALEALAGSFDG